MKEYAHKVVLLAAVKNHMWYLGSEMAPVSLFSSKACDDEKKSIVEALILGGDDWSVREIIMSGGLEKKQVHELLTSLARSSWRSFGLDLTILSGHGPLTNMKLLYFEKPKLMYIASIKVVDDAAEHFIALMSSFNQSITKTESEMQKRIQVIEDNRN